MKFDNFSLTKTNLLTTLMLLGILACGCSNNEKIIKERLELLTENYFNTNNEKPKIDSIKSQQISNEVYYELSKKYSDSEILEILNSRNNTDSQSIIDLIYNLSFPIAYNSRHTTFNDSTHIFYLDNFSKFYKPTIQNYRSAETLLISEIKKQSLTENSNNLDTLSIRNYYRQYSFYMNENKDSMVHINAFCYILDSPVDSCGIMTFRPWNWRKEVIFILDGGDCFWQTLINLTTKKIEYLSVNGV
jgi:hypothetical protein